MTKLKYLYVSIIIASFTIGCGSTKKLSQYSHYIDSLQVSKSINTEVVNNSVDSLVNIFDKKEEEVLNIEIVEEIVDLDTLQRPTKIVQRTIKIDKEKRDTINNRLELTHKEENNIIIVDSTAVNETVIEDIVVNEKVEKKGISTFSMGILTGIIIVIVLLLIWLYLKTKIKL